MRRRHAPSSFSEAPGRSAPTGPSTERKRSARNARPRRSAQRRRGRRRCCAPAPRRSRAPGCARESSRRRRRTRSPAAREPRARARRRRAARASGRSRISGETSRYAAPPASSAAVIAFAGSPSQRAARQTAAHQRRGPVRARASTVARDMASTFSGAKLPDRRAGQDQLRPRPSRPRRCPRARRRRRHRSRRAAIADAIRGGGTVTRSTAAGEPASRQPVVDERRMHRERERHAEAQRPPPRVAASARPVAAASRKPQPRRGDRGREPRSPRRSCRR